MSLCNNEMMLATQQSCTIFSYDINEYTLIRTVNVTPSIVKQLLQCDDIIRQHKNACLRITSLLTINDVLWIGSSAGIICCLANDVIHGKRNVSLNRNVFLCVFLQPFRTDILDTCVSSRACRCPKAALWSLAVEMGPNTSTLLLVLWKERDAMILQIISYSGMCNIIYVRVVYVLFIE